MYMGDQKKGHACCDGAVRDAQQVSEQRQDELDDSGIFLPQAVDVCQGLQNQRSHHGQHILAEKGLLDLLHAGDLHMMPASELPFMLPTDIFGHKCGTGTLPALAVAPC